MDTSPSSNLRGTFRKRRLRVTRPRQMIVDVLGNTKAHLSAEEVYLKVHAKYPNVGLTTVYRTLELLADMSIVLKQNFGDGRNRYELLENPKKPGHHHHLVCTSCKRVIDYDDFVDEEIALVRKLEKELSRKHRFRITNHVIEFHGVCTDCRKA